MTFPDNSTVSYTSHFLNAPFNIDQYIPADATTCPRPNQEFSFPNGIRNGALQADGVTPVGLPGGCTRDLVHKFYQEQYQLDGGRQDRYLTGSDSVGMSMGYYDTTAAADLRVPPRQRAPRTTSSPTSSSRARYGGSYLNHQYLIAAQPLEWPNPPAAQVADRRSRPGSSTPTRC